MPAKVIPVRNDLPTQRLRVELDGDFFRIRFYLNPHLDRWFMDFSNDADVLQAAGIPVVQSDNLLRPWRYKDVPQGQFLVLDTQSLQQDPSEATFGNRVLVAYLPEAESSA